MPLFPTTYTLTVRAPSTADLLPDAPKATCNAYFRPTMGEPQRHHLQLHARLLARALAPECSRRLPPPWIVLATAGGITSLRIHPPRLNPLLGCEFFYRHVMPSLALALGGEHLALVQAANLDGDSPGWRVYGCSPHRKPRVWAARLRGQTLESWVERPLKERERPLLGSANDALEVASSQTLTPVDDRAALIHEALDVIERGPGVPPPPPATHLLTPDAVTG